ncbi:hypothetical protein [Thioclava atlantica]|uniref:Uncharacterized protein n=1 Tax=Thioclava atlantica TaxID=1317124 RepID=A0A085TZH7_9RHOB|nr:hypothetical protein [Thioclava atlantica]KFE36124.1 hypothetical protein DW2_05825 [Thioclava atlantica]
MRPEDKSPDHHVAFGAAAEGVSAASASLAVVGRYWWNMQMRLLIATGVMRFFRAQWWLFIVVGFALLAFVFPLGVAFIVSAFCAGEMNPKAEGDYLVPLKRDDSAASVDASAEQSAGFGGPDLSDVLEGVKSAASLHHIGFLRALGRDVDDAEFAAAALGALDGTLQAHKAKVPNPDMHAMGVSFIARQLKDLGRMEELDPERIADLTLTAMSSEALEGIRIEAGRFSYGMEGLWSGAMRTGPAAV